jgi:hypothetical protein
LKLEIRSNLVTRLLPAAFLALLQTSALGADRDAAWSQDLHVLSTELPARHLDLFAHLAPADFDAAVRRLDAAIPTLKDPEIVVELMRLSAMAGDGHTWANPQVAPFYAGWRFFPLKLTWYPDGLRVVKTDAASSRLLGLRVVQIGGLPVEEVERLVTPLISHENDFWVRARSPLMLVSLEILQALKVLPEGTGGRYVLEAPDGSRVTADLQAKGLAEVGPVFATVPAPAPAPISLRHPDLYYWYQYLPTEKVLYFQYNVCMEQSGRPLSAFTSDLLSYVDTHPVDAFVIDLRYNNGGNSALIHPLYAGLAARRGKARVYCLVGRETYSSGLLNAMDLWNDPSITFAGEPTGGKPNHFGDILRFSLPNSLISVTYSTKFFRTMTADPSSLIPEAVFTPRYEDLAGSRDAVLEAILTGSMPATPRPAWSAAILAPLPGQRLTAGLPVRFSGCGTGGQESLTTTWEFGDGQTRQGTDVTHVFGTPGTYDVKLTVSGASGKAEAHAVLEIVPPAGDETELLLPVVLDVFGAGGSHYTTELTLVSRSASASTVELGYTASLGEGSGWISLQLAPGEMKVIPDAIGLLRQTLSIPSDGSSQVGTLRARFLGVAPVEAFVGGRTSTPGLGGTFGLFYPASAPTDGPVSICGLQQNDKERSNVALVNGGESTLTLRVQLTGPGGTDLGTVDQTLPAWGWAQINAPLAGKAGTGCAFVTRVLGTSPFTAYGVLNDAVTSDGSFVPARPGILSGPGDQLVPIVLDVQGIGGGRFTTELTLTNLTAAPLPATLVYSASLGAGSGEVPITLEPGEQRIVPDTISFLRSGGVAIPADGSSVGGALLMRTPSSVGAQDLAVGARTFTQAAGGGTFGLFYPGLTLGEAADSVAFVNGLQQNDRQRSNLAVVNWGDRGDPIDLEIVIHGSIDGLAAGSPVKVTLKPLEWLQLGQPLAPLGLSAGYARITRTSGSSRFVAYGVLNDAATSDGSYVPMIR